MNMFKKTMSGVLAVVLLGAGALVSCKDEKNTDWLTEKYNYDLAAYIELGQYTGLDAESYEIEVTEERIRREIDGVLYSYAKTTSVKDRGAELGNTVVIDYVGSGADMENVTVKDKELVLGGGAILEDIENGIVGYCAGETVSLDVTYPDPYEKAPSYAGRTVHYEITVKEVKVSELPMYTDDFVKGYLGYGSIAEFEAAVKQQLIDFSEESRLTYLVGQVWPKVLEDTNVLQYPTEELNAWHTTTVEINRTAAEQMGVSLAVYVKSAYDMTEEEFLEAVAEEAKAMVKEEMVIYSIARAENITLTDEEYKERATEYAIEIYGLESLEEFEEAYSMSSICTTLLGDKVREFVAAQANQIMGDSVTDLG